MDLNKRRTYRKKKGGSISESDFMNLFPDFYYYLVNAKNYNLDGNDTRLYDDAYITEQLKKIMNNSYQNIIYEIMEAVTVDQRFKDAYLDFVIEKDFKEKYLAYYSYLYYVTFGNEVYAEKLIKEAIKNNMISTIVNDSTEPDKNFLHYNEFMQNYNQFIRNNNMEGKSDNDKIASYIQNLENIYAQSVGMNNGDVATTVVGGYYRKKKVSEKEKERKLKEKEKEKERKLKEKEKEKARKLKEKEKEKARKLKEKERALKEKEKLRNKKMMLKGGNGMCSLNGCM
jgi:hypothetical protein